MVFAKETLTAQWSGTNPEISGSNVGIGWVLSPAPLTTNVINNPLGQLHVSQVRPFSFTPFSFTPIPQLFLSSYCESPIAFNGITNTSYAIESDCYDGNLKFNSIGSSGTSTNLFRMNNELAYFDLNNFNIKSHFFISNTQIVMNKQLVSNQNANFYQKVFIGDKTATFHPDAKLHVAGKVAAQHFVITKPTNWSDKVFQKGYNLRSLSEIEQFIIQNKHLPDVPSEAEVMEKGYDANELDALLLQKIEELTLFSIEQNKKIAELQKQVLELKKRSL